MSGKLVRNSYNGWECLDKDFWDWYNGCCCLLWKPGDQKNTPRIVAGFKIKSLNYA